MYIYLIDILQFAFNKPIRLYFVNLNKTYNH
jgi:hypothetical protein